MELAIATASGALSVALLDEGTIVAEHHVIVGRGHAESIVGVIAGVTGAHGRAVTGVIVDVGPGSFTGIRIGLAAAQALGLAWAVPVAGVGSLDLVAAAAFLIDRTDVVVAVADAGRGRVYWQAFDRAGCTPRDAAASGTADAVVVPDGALVAGTGAALMQGAGGRLLALYPRAADVRLLPPERRRDAVPCYLAAAVP